MSDLFEVTSGIPSDLLAELIAAACLLTVTMWVSWIAISSLRQLHQDNLTVGEVATRVMWSGLMFFMVVSIIAFVE